MSSDKAGKIVRFRTNGGNVTVFTYGSDGDWGSYVCRGCHGGSTSFASGAELHAKSCNAA
ncbi:hypothetical protein [Nonomuraea sp. NPDC046570]|uniref:hypothetical protein n=1 Tax=Nonomuraea sp. NPDC046570 TaxID=3155255 RepID=UPI0033F0EB89